MSDSVHRLPFSMKTVFQDLFLLTYTLPPAELGRLLPPYIHPFDDNGRSYISIVVGNMRGMRPGMLPEFIGTNYYQIVYRAVVNLVNQDGERLPGVFFLRSDGNDPVMSYFGNQFTEFRFHYFQTGAINLLAGEGEFLISAHSADRGGDLVAHLRNLGPAEHLPPAEGFASVTDEKDTLVQLFHAYAYDADRQVVYDLEIERGEWELQRLELLDIFTAFFMEEPFTPQTSQPFAHVYIQECSYVWKPMAAIPVSRLND